MVAQYWCVCVVNLTDGRYAGGAVLMYVLFTWQVVGTLVLVVLSSVSWSLYCLSTYQSFSEHVVPLQYCHCVTQAFVGLALLCFYLLFRPEVRTFCIRCCASGLSCGEQSDGMTSSQRRSDSADYKHARQRRGSAKGHRCFQADTSEIPPASASTEVPVALLSRTKIARSSPQYKAVSSSGPRTEDVRPSNKHSSKASSSWKFRRTKRKWIQIER